MQLETHDAGFELLDHRRRRMCVAAAEKSEVHRPCFGSLKHLTGVERTTGIDADRDRTERAADHRGDTAGQRMFDKAGAVEMNMDVDRAWRRNQSFAVPHSRAGRHDQTRIDAVHDGGIAALADADNATMPDAKITFDDSDHGIDDEDVAQEKIQRTFGAGNAGHADAITQRLAAAMQAFVAVNRVILFHDRNQLGIAQPH